MNFPRVSSGVRSCARKTTPNRAGPGLPREPPSNSTVMSSSMRQTQKKLAIGTLLDIHLRTLFRKQTVRVKGSARLLVAMHIAFFLPVKRGRRANEKEGVFMSVAQALAAQSKSLPSRPNLVHLK